MTPIRMASSCATARLAGNKAAMLHARALADLSGRGSVTAVQMAVEDFGGKVLGKRIEVLTLDHQSKPDVALNRAREWFDVQNVSMVTDLTNSAWHWPLWTWRGRRTELPSSMVPVPPG